MASTHLFKLSQTAPHDKTDAGIRIKANKANFPVLQGMSLYKLVLQPNGIREPHWHANADELAYCLAGEALVTLYNTGDTKQTFLVQTGDVFFIPSGALHGVENVGEGTAEFILNFSNEDPEDFSLSSTLGAFTDAVLGNTWDRKSQVFQNLKRSLKSTFAAFRKGAAVIPEESRYMTPYRYSLDASQPILANDGGDVHMARKNLWPILERQALYSLKLTGKGMREPHWHPETAELGYVKKGRGRMTILNPSGQMDTYIMEEGDIYFIPEAYPHHIENLQDDEPLLLMIFFNQGMPGDVGFTGSVRSFSDETLAAVLNSEPTFFEHLPKYYADLFIVNKVNPVEKIGKEL